MKKPKKILIGRYAMNKGAAGFICEKLPWEGA